METYLNTPLFKPGNTSFWDIWEWFRIIPIPLKLLLLSGLVIIIGSLGPHSEVANPLQAAMGWGICVLAKHIQWARTAVWKVSKAMQSLF